MKHQSLPLKLFALVAVMMSGLGASAYDFEAGGIFTTSKRMKQLLQVPVIKIKSTLEM